MLFQAGRFIVFLLFWQVPDILGDAKADKLLKDVSLIYDSITELKEDVHSLLKLSQDKFTELKQEVDSFRKQVGQSCQFSPLDRVPLIKEQPYINRTRITLWGNTTALSDTTTDKGGWIIIQRRTNDDVDFFRGWNEYKTGFGNLDTGLWIGNNAIHRLAEEGYNELRIDLIYEGRWFYAHYSNFYVASEAMNYKLTVGAFEGTAGDALAYHNNMYFSTFDRDNDKSSTNCADVYRGAWWFNACNHSDLNGPWGVQTTKKWYTLTGHKPVSFSEMKIRRG